MLWAAASTSPAVCKRKHFWMVRSCWAYEGLCWQGPEQFLVGVRSCISVAQLLTLPLAGCPLPTAGCDGDWPQVCCSAPSWPLHPAREVLAASVIPVSPKARSLVGFVILISFSSHFWALWFASKNGFMIVGLCIPAWSLLRPGVVDHILC